MITHSILLVLFSQSLVYWSHIVLFLYIWIILHTFYQIAVIVLNLI